MILGLLDVRHKLLKLVMLFAMLCATITTAAQTSLNLHTGLGKGLFRDQGVSPLTYQGAVIQPGLDVNIVRPRWRIYCTTKLTGGIYNREFSQLKKFNYSTYGGSAELFVKGYYSCFKNDRWNLLGGVSLGDYIGCKNTSKFMNANFAVEDFIFVGLQGRAEFTLKRWKFYGELGVNPFAYCYAPGFSYIDNFTADIDDKECLFNTYEWHGVGFPALSTEIGAWLNLRSGNRIGLAYNWDFLTTRNATTWKYEEARHALVLQLDFILKAPKQ